MKKPRPRKQPALKAFRRRKQRKQRKSARQQRLVTKREARLLAARHVVNRLFKGAAVVDGATSSLNIYGVRRADTWVVAKRLESLVLRASEVVVICKRTGRVLHDGLASDEG